MPTTIALYTEIPTLLPQIKILATRLNLPITQTPTPADYLLVLTPDHLELRIPDTNPPFTIDFLSGKLAYRQQHTSLRREMLARAMGLKSHSTPNIVDATAGLGRDSFILASLGFEITLLERTPIIFALLEDGLTRAKHNTTTAPIINRMHLIHADAMTWLPANPSPDIIYLDPMFPERSKSALVKKDMRIFHDLVGDDIDATDLFKTALACATQRVVVKRPRLAAALGGLHPSFTLSGSSSRFDIYLIGKP